MRKFMEDEMDLREEYETMCKAARKAANELNKLINQGFETAYKLNQDPVTTGDLLVNNILQMEFQEKFPEYGWLSEETRDNPERVKNIRTWIVDPIEGTKELRQHHFSIILANSYFSGILTRSANEKYMENLFKNTS